MREVRTCDFCGDAATGLYEPLPQSIPEAPRLILCAGCRDRLTTVVDPLVERIDADPDTAVTDLAEPDDWEREVDASPRGAGGADRSSDGVTSDGATSGGSGPDRSADGVDAPERRAADAGSADLSETVDLRRDAASNSGDRPSDDVEVSESRDASGRPQRDRAGTPHGYRKVMRFLENREFPVEREEAERLATAAYDLEPSAVAEAIDHAVQYGRLREVDGELKR